MIIMVITIKLDIFMTAIYALYIPSTYVFFFVFPTNQALFEMGETFHQQGVFG
jgi:hypothetical protein